MFYIKDREGEKEKRSGEEVGTSNCRGPRTRVSGPIQAIIGGPNQGIKVGQIELSFDPDAVATYALNFPVVRSSATSVLEDVPGFHRPRAGEKGKKVDVVVIDPKTQLRTLVTIKWSVRADREEQFESDFKAYERLESAGNPFGYALVTCQ